MLPPVYPHRLPDGVTEAEEHLGHVWAEDGHLGHVPYVDRVDEPAGAQIVAAHLQELGRDAQHLAGRTLSAGDYLTSPLHLRGHPDHGRRHLRVD